LAKRWDCSEALIHQMVKSGQIKKLAFAALVWISAAEVDRIEAED